MKNKSRRLQKLKIWKIKIENQKKFKISKIKLENRNLKLK